MLAIAERHKAASQHAVDMHAGQATTCCNVQLATSSWVSVQGGRCAGEDLT